MDSSHLTFLNFKYKNTILLCVGMKYCSGVQILTVGTLLAENCWTDFYEIWYGSYRRLPQNFLISYGW
jgi:hypothetical protein